MYVCMYVYMYVCVDAKLIVVSASFKPGFLKLLLLVHWYLCVSALRVLRTSGMIWCDADQVLQIYPFFRLPYMTLVIDKMDGCGLSNTVHHECLTKDAVLSKEREV